MSPKCALTSTDTSGSGCTLPPGVSSMTKYEMFTVTPCRDMGKQKDIKTIPPGAPSAVPTQIITHCTQKANSDISFDVT
eukprot:1382031-Amphidinium_carterae.2